MYINVSWSLVIRIRIRIDLKCWIRIHIDINMDPKHRFFFFFFFNIWLQLLDWHQQCQFSATFFPRQQKKVGRKSFVWLEMFDKKRIHPKVEKEF